MLQRLVASNNRFVQLLATRSKKKTPSGKREVFSQSARTSKEYIEKMKEEVSKKRLVKDKKVFEELTPRFVAAMLFGCVVPQSLLLYKMIWADACSDTFFQAFEVSMTWIATLSALEGAAGCALGYIDFKIKHGNPPDLILAMRKKRLAFAKFSFIMAVGSLLLIDKPSPNAVVPLIIG